MSPGPGSADDLGWQSTTTWTWTAATTVVVTVVYGTVYWTAPYNEIEIVIAAMVGGFWGLIAAGIGELVLRVRR